MDEQCRQKEKAKCVCERGGRERERERMVVADRKSKQVPWVYFEKHKLLSCCVILATFGKNGLLLFQLLVTLIKDHNAMGNIRAK